MTDLTLVRNNIQLLLAKIEDEIILQQFYNALLWFSKSEEGQLWNTLSASQQNEVLESYEESEDEANLIPHEEAKHRHAKWLTK
jgi:hypothetical protein